jgi:hypothetical protein
MFDPSRPGRYVPTPLDGPDLRVHPQRQPDGLSRGERALVLVFLRRYVVWRARRRDIEGVRDALALLLELATP